MRIAFVLPGFGVGGAERVASLLCNSWTKRGHTVTAITFESPGDEPSYTLHEAIDLRQIDTVHGRKTFVSRVVNNGRRILRLRSALRAARPDIVVAFMTEANVLTLCAAVSLGIPVVISERNQPERPGLGVLHRLARRLTYPLASAVVVQTKAIADWINRQIHSPVLVIPNPVSLETTVEPTIRGSDKRIAAVGRLVRQKGFDILIASFAQIVRHYPNWTLHIYGEGTERSVLEAQIESLSLSDRIQLHGVTNDLLSVYAGASIFVLPSRYEGHPNVLLEALSMGCPVIATDCPGATSDILHGGRYGLPIPPDDVEALRLALDRMISDEPLRATYSGRAREAVTPLEVGTIADRWLDLFSAIANPSR